jgi:DNA-binding LytR/AlgR family response regulator
MKILVVEDEMIISEDIRWMLEERNYTVTDQAVDYDDAIQSIENNPPDLVLLDINLKGAKTGIDVAVSLNEKLNIPFIYTSSLGDKTTIDLAKATNPSAYLVKPFKEEQLMVAIEIAISNFDKKINTKHQEGVAIYNDAIFVKDKHKIVKVFLTDIMYLKKCENYLDIYTAEERFTVRSTINGFIDSLGFNKLYRIHKSYAVNLDFVSGMTQNSIMLDQIEVPLSKSYAIDLKSKLRIF